MRKLYVRISCVLILVVIGVALVACVEPEPDRFTITFNSNGGTTVQTLTGIASGSTISQPKNPTRPNYEFVAWYRDYQLTRKWTFSTDTVTQNLTLFASWQAKSMVVRFDLLYDGAPAVNGIYVAYNAQYSQLPSPQRDDGAIFGGWWSKNGLANDDWGTMVSVGNINTNTEDHVLYARWYYNTKLVLEFNGGSRMDGLLENEYDVKAGQDAYITMIPEGKLPEMAQRGFRFDGWYSKNGYNNGQLNGDWGEKIEPLMLIKGEIGKEVVIYAKWTRVITVDLVTNGGRGIITTVGLLPNEPYNITMPVKTGAIFDGWYTQNMVDEKGGLSGAIYGYTPINIGGCMFEPSNPANAAEVLKLGINEGHCSKCNVPLRNGDYFPFYEEHGYFELYPALRYTSWGERIFPTTILKKLEDHVLYAKWIEGVRSAVSAGGGIGNYVDDDGQLWTWGGYSATLSLSPSNVRGDGGNTNTARQYPRVGEDHKGKKYAQVVSGYEHTLAIDYDGNLWGWGYNNNGVIKADGTHNRTLYTTPQQIMKGRKFIDIAVNGSNAAITYYGSYAWQISDYYFFCLAVEDNGDLWAWGNNSWGQLGNGSTAHTVAPFRVNKIAGSQIESMKFTTVSAGADFSVAITDDGRMWSWGARSNTAPQLGVSSTNYKLPAQIAGSSRFIMVECGSDYSLAVDDTSRLWAWGNQANGRLGNGATSGSRSTPQNIMVSSRFITIAASNGSSFAIDADGKLWAWGANDNGQLGLGNSSMQSTPQMVMQGSVRFASISVGSSRHYQNPNNASYYQTYTVPDAQTHFVHRFHVVALAFDGDAPVTVYGWGNNDFGQVGDSTHTARNTPQILNQHFFHQ